MTKSRHPQTEHHALSSECAFLPGSPLQMEVNASPTGQETLKGWPIPSSRPHWTQNHDRSDRRQADPQVMRGSSRLRSPVPRLSFMSNRRHTQSPSQKGSGLHIFQMASPAISAQAWQGSGSGPWPGSRMNKILPRNG